MRETAKHIIKKLLSRLFLRCQSLVGNYFRQVNVAKQSLVLYSLYTLTGMQPVQKWRSVCKMGVAEVFIPWWLKLTSTASLLYCIFL